MPDSDSNAIATAIGSASAPTVVWWNPDRMSFSCCHMLNEMFDSYHAYHLTRYDAAARTLPGAVLVFHGGLAQSLGNGPANAALMNDLASRWAWCIFISIGDEATEFPSHLLSHPNSRLWIQAPLSTTRADRYLIQGYPDHTRRVDVPRDLDIFFAGQVTHPRRHDCAAAIRSLPLHLSPSLFTDAFGSGYSQSEYLTLMSRARVVPCPSGPSTPDTFRVYESLECGAIPILDSRSLRDSTVGVWPLLLGDHPLPIIREWSDLPSILPNLLTGWDYFARWIGAWWRAYKHQYSLMLAHDLISLGAIQGGRNGREEATPAIAP